MKTIIIPFFIFLSLFNISCKSDLVNKNQFSEIWINNDIQWTTNLRNSKWEDSENGRVLYLGKNKSFAYILNTLNKKNGNDTISFEVDESRIFRGKWNYLGDDILIKYHLADAILLLPGEKIPGPEQIDTLKIIKNTSGNIYLRFKNKIYIPYNSFSKNALKTITWEK